MNNLGQWVLKSMGDIWAFVNKQSDRQENELVCVAICLGRSIPELHSSDTSLVFPIRMQLVQIWIGKAKKAQLPEAEKYPTAVELGHCLWCSNCLPPEERHGIPCVVVSEIVCGSSITCQSQWLWHCSRVISAIHNHSMLWFCICTGITPLYNISVVPSCILCISFLYG